MLTFDTQFRFVTPYIGHPYSPAMYQLIEIQKKSGMNRAKSAANRRAALEEELRRLGMTLADYEALDVEAQKPFHYAEDGEIVIPAFRVMSFLVAANDIARAAQRACPADQVWSRIVSSDFRTGRHAPDGVWSRFVTVTLGTGAKASNQRALRENPYIEGFCATGTISFDEETVDPRTLENLIRWAGQFVGIGACRKMGKGRFELAAFARQAQPLRKAA